MGQLRIGPKHLLNTAPHYEQELSSLKQQIHENEQKILRLVNQPKETIEVEKIVEKVIEKPVQVEKIIYKTIEVPKEVKIIEERIVERTIEIQRSQGD